MFRPTSARSSRPARMRARLGALSSQERVVWLACLLGLSLVMNAAGAGPAADRGASEAANGLDAQPLLASESGTSLTDEDLVASLTDYFACVLSGGDDCEQHLRSGAVDASVLADAAAAMIQEGGAG